MALWLVRAGRHGEHEAHFFSTNAVYLTWSGIFGGTDITSATSYSEVKEQVVRLYPDERPAWQGHTAGQWWAFVVAMKPGDWVATPLKSKAAIAIGEVLGPCQYNRSAADGYQVSRPIKWLNREVPRSAFDQDLLYSLGAFMTVCEIKRNDAELRVRAMANSGWKSTRSKAPKDDSAVAGDSEAEASTGVDLERIARDSIADLITRRFKGHPFARLVAAVLEAQGYSTLVSPEGTDKGVDILAGTGSLGFGAPRLCVQVKSGDSPVDRPTLDQLIGAMQNFGAEQGLFVSWGGFKSSVDRERAGQFFRVRMWDADGFVEQLLANYEKLPEEIRAELPLKRIWTVAGEDDE